MTYLWNIPTPGVTWAWGTQEEGISSLASAHELHEAPQLELPWRVETAFTVAVAVVLEFSNAPCDWLPRPSHPAPDPDWPRGVPVIIPSEPLGAGGAVTWPPVWCRV